MKLMLSACGLLFAGASVLAQSFAPVPLSKVVAAAPTTSQTINIDAKRRATLLTWRISDRLTPYSGTTLVWLEASDSDVRLAIDPQPRFEDARQTRLGADASMIAIVGGGMWSGTYDQEWTKRQPDGLVVAAGIPKGQLRETANGGTAVICGDDVSIVPAAAYPKQIVRGTVAIPCNKPAPSVLQSSALLVRGGAADPLRDDTPANRLALGSGGGRVVIAGAFNSAGQALTLRQFAEFVAAAAQVRKIDGFSALNLNGDCSAQLVVPELGAFFGCEGKNYTANRIVMRRGR